MLKKRLILLPVLFFIAACGSNEANKMVDSKDAKVETALQFINGYVDNANKMKDAVEVVAWATANTYASASFKKEVKRIVDEANHLDPEMGLGFDPIFDAQDNPEKAFEFEAIDEKTNYITLKGKDMGDFKLTVKVIEQNGKFLVEGCGMVNVPQENRVKR